MANVWFFFNIEGFNINTGSLFFFLDDICVVISDVFLSLNPLYRKDSESVLVQFNKRRCSTEKEVSISPLHKSQ